MALTKYLSAYHRTQIYITLQQDHYDQDSRCILDLMHSMKERKN